MLSEGAKLTGESGKTYLVVSPLGQANVWTAVESNDDPKSSPRVVVVKEPGPEDTEPGWPNFQNEMVMHALFKDSPAIRQQLDRIPPAKRGDPPMLVLEITETTLWGARTKRPMSLAEIKSVAKDVLVGLRDVHAQGLVYADLKPQNIMIDGFDTKHESDPALLTAKVGDLGIVTAPIRGKVQPISYRAPEVFLKGDITSRIDVWGWALIYCHLLEARTRFSKTGLYDDLDPGDGSVADREEAVSSALTNDYKLQNNSSYSGVPMPKNDPSKHKGDQWELLRQRGLEDGEVDFLRWVLKADPHQRPTVTQILECGWLDKTEEEVAAGFTPPAWEFLEYDPQRATPDEVAAQEKLEAANNAHYFEQGRPSMSNKRYHSLEEEVPVKKTNPVEQRHHGVEDVPVKPTQVEQRYHSVEGQMPVSKPIQAEQRYDNVAKETPANKPIQAEQPYNSVRRQMPTNQPIQVEKRWSSIVNEMPVNTTPAEQPTTEIPATSTENTGTYLSYR